MCFERTIVKESQTDNNYEYGENKPSYREGKKKNHCKLSTMMYTSFVTYQFFVTHRTVGTPQPINGNNLDLNMKSQNCLQHEFLWQSYFLSLRHPQTPNMSQDHSNKYLQVILNAYLKMRHRMEVYFFSNPAIKHLGINAQMKCITKCHLSAYCLVEGNLYSSTLPC
jgi:hypothetical protein